MLYVFKCTINAQGIENHINNINFRILPDRILLNGEESRERLVISTHTQTKERKPAPLQ